MFDISVFSQNVNNASCFPIEVTPRHFNKKKKSCICQQIIFFLSHFSKV